MEQAIKDMIAERETKVRNAERRAADFRKHGASISAARNQSRADAIKREIAILQGKLNKTQGE